MPFQVVSLLLVSLSFVLMEENGIRTNPKILQRRYSEATLASDYSRTLDNMLKKNFVDWLLTRRENKMDNSIDPSKREVESPTLNTSSRGYEAASQGTKDFFICLLQQSLTLPKDPVQCKNILKQEFLDWLISADLCRPMSHNAFGEDQKAELLHQEKTCC
ncbi:gastric inhibitory polypeptide [Eublepharis macularius]|uniref:Gastric inhibitory polypeptide n=1 Tax=Eublepharis macularius TaxID=481883 RepID=A0AA97K670_EUBMA|nr:gastric inhibitory polypeptide [Eublepharis macularius]